MRIGIFGGTFDPVHYGHLLLAECCREQCGLDEIWFMPAATPPHKQSASISSPKDRVTMLELAVAGNAAFRVVCHELDRGGVSYTVETLAEIHQTHPNEELFVLMGADSLRDFPTWREPARICELAIPVVVGRHETNPPDLSSLRSLVPSRRMAEIERYVVTMPRIELSASEIRARAATGQSIRYRTPAAVEAYIVSQRLYSATRVASS